MGSEDLPINDPIPSQENRVTMKVVPVAFTKAKSAELWADIPTKKKEQCIEKYGSLHVSQPENQPGRIATG